MNQPQIESMTEQALVEYLTEQPTDKFHLVEMWARPGVRALNNLIEHTWFPPGTPSNDLLGFVIHIWEDVLFYVLSIPKDKFGAVRNLANILHLVVREGVPLIMPVPATHPNAVFIHKFNTYGVGFPGGKMPDGTDNMNMFTIENLKSPAKLLPDNQIEQREAIVGKILQHRLLKPQQVADFIYGKIDQPDWMD